MRVLAFIALTTLVSYDASAASTAWSPQTRSDVPGGAVHGTVSDIECVPVACNNTCGKGCECTAEFEYHEFQPYACYTAEAILSGWHFDMDPAGNPPLRQVSIAVEKLDVNPDDGCGLFRGRVRGKVFSDGLPTFRLAVDVTLLTGGLEPLLMGRPVFVPCTGQTDTVCNSHVVIPNNVPASNPNFLGVVLKSFEMKSRSMVGLGATALFADVQTSASIINGSDLEIATSCLLTGNTGSANPNGLECDLGAVALYSKYAEWELGVPAFAAGAASFSGNLSRYDENAGIDTRAFVPGYPYGDGESGIRITGLRAFNVLPDEGTLEDGRPASGAQLICRNPEAVYRDGTTGTAWHWAAGLEGLYGEGQCFSVWMMY